MNALSYKGVNFNELSDTKNSEDNYMNTNEIEKMLKNKKSSKSSFSNIWFGKGIYNGFILNL